MPHRVGRLADIEGGTPSAKSQSGEYWPNRIQRVTQRVELPDAPGGSIEVNSQRRFGWRMDGVARSAAER